MTQFTVLSLFPEMFEAITASGITSRAIKQGLLRVEVVNPREFTQDRHRTVDDRPYGGGPGMLMMVEPLRKALVSVLSGSDKVKPKVVYMSPQGKPFTQKLAQQWAAEEQIILVAGRYEGIDQRFIDEFVDEEVSLGDFVVSGGELPAMMVIDAVSRCIPGVLGHELSAQEDSFFEGLLDHPQYTRPEQYSYEGDGEKEIHLAVPEVLLGGNHESIRQWRLRQAIERTWSRRPDLIRVRKQQGLLTAEEQAMLDEIGANFNE